jgi:hypothetical protein
MIQRLENEDLELSSEIEKMKKKFEQLNESQEK